MTGFPCRNIYTSTGNSLPEPRQIQFRLHGLPHCLFGLQIPTCEETPHEWPKARDWWKEHLSWQVASVTVQNSCNEFPTTDEEEEVVDTGEDSDE